MTRCQNLIPQRLNKHRHTDNRCIKDADHYGMCCARTLTELGIKVSTWWNPNPRKKKNGEPK